ncbi:MAG: hypothetical protein H8D95_00470 [Candidatus Endolissoclinum sp.]|nr:hypothetical protein [Candidatus Endolissoclinum sp.]
MEIPSYTTENFSTYKGEFSATLIQTTSMLMSDIFEVEVEFGWLSNDYAKSNAAFLKIKFFIESLIHQSIMTHPTAKINLANIENKIVMLPHPPSNDVIAMVLHAKLNSIVDDYIQILSVKVGSKAIDPVISYTHADDEYPGLPPLSEWVKEDDYYYAAPWWFRNSTDTDEIEITEETDLTNVPKPDTILEDLEKAILGELKIEKPGGEIVEISDWKPEIIKD